jgi:hypothetical protein
MMNQIESKPASDAAPAGRQGVIAQCINRVGRCVSDWMRRAALRDEIAALEWSGELDALLADTGYSRWELEHMVRGYPQADRLLPAMADRLGLDLARLDAGERYEMRHTCALCKQHRACHRWLKDEASAGLAPFCPNATAFAAALHPQDAGQPARH